MRVLLLHPEDSPRRGPWSRQRWDLIVDLGKSSRYSAEAWGQQYGCPVLRADSYRRGVADAKRVRQLLSAFRNQLIDEEGLDWWELTSLLVAPEALDLVAFERIAAEIKDGGELWSTRPGWPANAISALLGRPLQSFDAGGLARSAARAKHYAGLLRRFSTAQIKEIALDKYDAGYRWRSRFASRQKRLQGPVVLVPTAYGNVSRTAASYARLLPQQTFLMVATRQSARKFELPANVEVRDLAAYAKGVFPSGEVASLVERWGKMRASIESTPELKVLSQCGVLDSLPNWLRDGLGARDAWREVIEREPVSSVLCGDDSNLYTRLPVLLAAKRKIPTADFHHGAFDGRYLLKDLPCDIYLAKNEMERDYLVRVCGLPAERIAVGGPPVAHASQVNSTEPDEKTAIIFFSEPYEGAGMRAEEVYRELLPPLCRIARDNGRQLILKLHPFESPSQRNRIVRDILAADDARHVTVLDGFITKQLMAQAWFGITVESTTVMDCLQHGVCCFICGWLAVSPFEYMRQFARYGVGELLESAQQLAEITGRLAGCRKNSSLQWSPSQTVDPEKLQKWLTRPGDE